MKKLSKMSEEEFEQHIDNFTAEFALLVRKYAPDYVEAVNTGDFLYRIQEKTSCFNPYVWSSTKSIKKDIK